MSISLHGKNGHLTNHIQHQELRSDNTLFVIGVISNFVRWHSRYRIAREWIRVMENTANVKLCLVETAFGDREHECTEHGNPWHLQLRTDQSIWIKESMINLGIARLLPKNWKYAAWIDMDVFFDDPGWALETIHQLQHYPVVQPWSDCLDMDAQGGVLQLFKSFGLQHQRRVKKQMHPGQKEYQYAHTGFAWACTRAFWEAVRGLPDYCILGSCDHNAGFAMIGEVKHTIHGQMGPGFARALMEWQERAVRVTKKEVGFVNGTVKHSFHGPKAKRYYRERWQILLAHKFDPYIDIIHDTQGLVRLVGKPDLDHEIHRYNLSRHEDQIS